MPALKPRELAACAWAFAQMGYTPDMDWLDAFAAQVWCRGGGAVHTHGLAGCLRSTGVVQRGGT